VTVDNLYRQHRQGKSSGSPTRTNFFLQIPNDGDEKTTRRGRLASAICYAHIQPVPRQKNWDIIYLFFYPYNSSISKVGKFEHEGDWEHIRVRVDADGTKILKVFFAAHDKEGKWYRHKSLDPVKGFSKLGNHPIVYSALHSHASYPRAGKQNRRDLPDDHTERGRGPWNTWLRVGDVGDRLHPLNGQDWLRYSGRWGEIGLWGFTTGPFGPAFKNWWLPNEFHPPLPGPARLVFYQKNGCRGAFAETSDSKGQVINTKRRKRWKNDFYRSLKLINVRQGAKIYVYDSPGGNRNDDWTLITVRNQVPAIRINSFERNRDDKDVKVTYHARSRLDGKVSRIEIA
jgi:hypothetical protein